MLLQMDGVAKDIFSMKLLNRIEIERGKSCHVQFFLLQKVF